MNHNKYRSRAHSSLHSRISTYGALFIGALAVLGNTASAQQPAFPGAEGAGKFTTGGRGGDVYHVTNLNDSGIGSLRFGIDNAAGPRTIVFDVGGTIDLSSRITIGSPNLTIAGQTAPGGGITLKGGHLQVDDTNDVIIRYLRSRPGDVISEPNVYEPDSMTIVRSENVILDHVSTSWSTDEVLSTTLVNNVTVQWSLITEALHNSNHSKGNHGYGSIISGGDITFHHNLYANNRSRNPRPQGETTELDTRLDFVNNVIYNPGERYGYGGADNMYLNFVNNYGISGPNTSYSRLFFGASSGTQIYQSNNYMDTDKDGTLDGNVDGWSDFGGTYTQVGSRFNLPLTAVESAPDALTSVLAEAGASKFRDAVDTRVIADVMSYGTAGDHLDSQDEVGGWPALPGGVPQVDADQDGMPDAYENSLAYLNPNDASDRNSDGNSNGYTDLEDYLHLLTVSVDTVAAHLAIDRSTGAISLHNDTLNPLNLRGYSIASSLGALDSTEWKSVTDNYDVDGPNTADSGALIGSIDTDDSWNIDSSPGQFELLAESESSGDGGQIGPGGSALLSAGGAWIQSPNENDLLAQIILEDGAVVSIPIVFTGGAPLARGDLNFDGAITAADWIRFRDNFPADLSSLTIAQSYALGDLDGDLDVDSSDWLLFRSDYNATNGPGAFAAMLNSVPEPSSLILLAMGLMVFLAPRFR